MMIDLKCVWLNTVVDIRFNIIASRWHIMPQFWAFTSWIYIYVCVCVCVIILPKMNCEWTLKEKVSDHLNFFLQVRIYMPFAVSLMHTKCEQVFLICVRWCQMSTKASTSQASGLFFQKLIKHSAEKLSYCIVGSTGGFPSQRGS